MTAEGFTTENAIWSDVKLPPWWLVLIEGILLGLIGLFLIFSPYGTLFSIFWVLGLYWLIKGIIDLVSLIWDRTMWGWKIVAGILGIVAGYIVLQHPITSTVVLSVTAVWLLALIGLFLGISALIRGLKGAGWGTTILGIVIIILAIVLMFHSAVAATILPWVLGFFAIAGGIIAIFQSFQLRSVEHTIEDAKEKLSS